MRAERFGSVCPAELFIINLDIVLIIGYYILQQESDLHMMIDRDLYKDRSNGLVRRGLRVLIR